ncbi:MAG: hypothetical protein AAF551_03640 [Bacteroidota bacterium]
MTRKVPFVFLLWWLPRYLFAQVIQIAPSYTAGAPISLSYEKADDQAFLQIGHSYGSMLLKGEVKEGKTIFSLPEVVTKKKGILTFQLYSNKDMIWSGKTLIQPDTSTQHIEPYCGPKHLVVGRGDFSVLTASILDKHDNPYPPGKQVRVHTLVNNQENVTGVPTDGLLGFTRVYAPENTGYGAVSVQEGKAFSKEFRLDFYAIAPSDFTISYKRQHTYADGNQLVTLTTSTIKDAYSNTVENGTLVYFQIKDHLNQYSFASGETIDGVAHIEVPAPNYPTQWDVTSYVSYYAKTRPIRLKFSQAFENLPVLADSEGIKIGPIIGFMGQFPKNGMLVELVLKQKDTVSYLLKLDDGRAFFDYKKRLITSGDYSATISLGTLIHDLTVCVDE